MIDDDVAPVTPATRSAASGAGRAWGVTALLMAFMVVNFADKSVLGLAADPIRRDLGLSATAFGLANSAFFLLFSLSGAAVGLLADRIRPRWLLLAMAVVWSAAQVPMALGAGFGALVGSRIVLGAAEGPAYPVAQHTVFTWFTDRRRNLPGALITIGTALGVVIAAPTLTWMIDRHGWRSAFAVVAVAGLVWAVLWFCFGREGTVAQDPATEYALAPSADLGQPSYRRILRSGTWIGATAAYFAAYWAVALTLVWMPSYLHDGLGYPTDTAAEIVAAVWAITGVVMLAQAGLTSRLTARGVPSRWARAGVGGCALVLGAFGCVALAAAHRGPAVILLLVVGFGLAGVMVSISFTTVAELVPAGRRGGALGLLSAVGTAAGLIAPTVTGRLVDLQGPAGYRHAVLLCAAVLLIGGIAALTLVDPARDARRLAG
ncbi:MFS transporter [Actinospica robiniae]|uniref:MFS transporter n=1 Tax=Actinospica robiniae TaxID=304901 RepID=UPI000419EBA0|nr:MFS transporter [Actinospica robiniae]